MLSVINKKEGQEMKRMENDRNGLPSLQYQAWESLTVAAERGLKNIPQHWEPNGHVSARCHCHPLSTSVGWPQTPSCWKQLDTAPHTRPTVCRMPNPTGKALKLGPSLREVRSHLSHVLWHSAHAHCSLVRNWIKLDCVKKRCKENNSGSSSLKQMLCVGPPWDWVL